MGKIKPRRQRNARFNPMGVSETRPTGTGNDVETVLAISTDGESGDITHAGLKRIGDQLSSSEFEERVSGLNTLAALALDDHAATVIADSRLVRKVSHLLKDPNAEVRLVAAGALRNISAGGSDEVVEAMVQQDVLSPLADLLQEYQNAWSPITTDLGEVATKDVEPMSNIFINATHFLLNLCECSEEAIRVFNQEGLVHVLLRHLDPSTWGHSLSLAAAECLLCASENNTNAQTVLIPAADSLVQFISRPSENPVELHFAANIAGLLMNISYCTSEGTNFQLLLQLLATILKADTVMLATEYASQSSNGPNVPMVPQDLEHLILAQQVALEMLSNLCFPDEDDLDESELASDDDEDDGESMDTGTGAFLSPEIQEGIVHFNLFQLSLGKVQYPDETTCVSMESLKHGSSLLKKLSTLQVRALLCLQNMISALDLKDVGGPELMYTTWVNLGTMVFKKPCEDSILEAASGAMRAIIEKLSEDKCEKVAEIPLQDIKVILEAGVSCTLASVRANLARMVGTLGCLLVTQNSEESLYSEDRSAILHIITEFLLKMGAHDSELWVSAEALDVIIDLYSDDKTDKLAARTYLVDSLKEIQPNFKSKYQKQKKKLGDHRALVLTVKDNLLAFIKYKGPRAVKHRST